MPTPICQLTLEWQRPDGSLERVTFDASSAETFETTAEATDHAVERGQDVTDYVKPNGDTFTAEAWVTNTPITTPATQADGAEGTVRGVSRTINGRSVSFSTLQFSSRFDRVRGVEAAVRALVPVGQVVKVYTGLRLLEDMVLLRCKAERSAETGSGAIPLTLEFKRVRFAAAQRVAAPRRVRRREARGPQPAAPVDPRSGAYAIGVDDGSGRPGWQNLVNGIFGR